MPSRTRLMSCVASSTPITRQRQDAARMGDQVVLLDPGDLAVGPRHGAAGEDQAARLLVLTERELRIARHRDLARTSRDLHAPQLPDWQPNG